MKYAEFKEEMKHHEQNYLNAVTGFFYREYAREKEFDKHCHFAAGEFLIDAIHNETSVLKGHAELLRIVRRLVAELDDTEESK